MTENNRIEYKRELTDTLEKEVVAFLNYRDGGIIYIGIDKVGNAFGVPSCDEVQLKIKDRLRNNIRPSIMGLFDIVHEERDDKDIIRITLAGGLEKPYHLKKFGMTEKGCFLRVGSASEPMPQEMIDMLYGSRVRNTIGRMESTRHNLTFEQLHIYYDTRGLKLTSVFMHNLELLTPDDKSNYAAYLLADENGSSMQVAKYADTTRVDLVENRDFGRCSLVKALKSVLERMDVENTIFTKIGYPLREEREMINGVAMREAVVNAVVHNDYANGATPKFEFFSDRLEITSAGGLPYGVTQEDFFNGYSTPRNKEIMRVFRDLEIVEQLGSGIPRILEHYGRDAFVFSPNFLRLVFPFKQPISNVTKSERRSQAQVGTKSGLSQVQVEAQVGPAILRACQSKPLSSGDIAKSLGHSQLSGNIRKALTSLHEDGLILYTIPDKPRSRLQQYKITPKGLDLLGVMGGEAQVEAQVKAQVEAQVDSAILLACKNAPQASGDISKSLGHNTLSGNIRKALTRLRENYLIAYTIPDKPRSRLQQYKITQKGFDLLSNLHKES